MMGAVARSDMGIESREAREGNIRLSASRKEEGAIPLIIIT